MLVLFNKGCNDNDIVTMIVRSMVPSANPFFLRELNAVLGWWCWSANRAGGLVVLVPVQLVVVAVMCQ